MKRVMLTTEERRRMRIELTEKLSPLLIDGHDTICNHIRLLHKTSLTDFQRQLCEEIMFLAKKITKKLKEYRGLK